MRSSENEFFRSPGPLGLHLVMHDAGLPLHADVKGPRHLYPRDVVWQLHLEHANKADASAKVAQAKRTIAGQRLMGGRAKRIT